MWPAIVVMIGVLGGIVVMRLRFRERDPNDVAEADPRQHAAGTCLDDRPGGPSLLGLGVPMVKLIFDLGREPSEDAYYIDVIGAALQLVFEYPEITDPDGMPCRHASARRTFPGGREVAFRLTSIDVIHSFWVPRLGGKLDVDSRT